MKLISRFSAVAILATTLWTTTLSAKECVNIKDVDVMWTSYKTLAKVGVSGTFEDVTLHTAKNTPSVKDALKGSSVQLDMNKIDAKEDVKTNNILKYFVANLSDTKIDAKIVKVYADSLDINISLNGKEQVIPMSYKIEGEKVVAKGVIDALDFKLSPALEVLNTNVVGHLNKGWYDIPVSFNLNLLKKCM